MSYVPCPIYRKRGHVTRSHDLRETIPIVSSKGPKDNPKYYSKGEGNMSIILLISLKYNRGRPYKNSNIIVFL